jgi:cell division septum initiation protein DivIVA
MSSFERRPDAIDDVPGVVGDVDPVVGGDPAATDDPEELRRRIEQTREDLGETVSALSDKTDVKAQASAKADELKEKAQEKAHEVTDTAKVKAETVAEQAKENPVPVVIGALVVLVVLNRIRKRRGARRRERHLLEDALQHSLAGGRPVAALLVDGAEVRTAA